MFKDKATVEMECMEEGYLAKILRGDGEKEIKVGEVTFIFGSRGIHWICLYHYLPFACDQWFSNYGSKLYQIDKGQNCCSTNPKENFHITVEFVCSNMFIPFSFFCMWSVVF